MLGVSWNGLGKKFGLRWVFRNQIGSISPGEHVLIKGSNGSGKSTFGKLLVAATDATAGTLVWTKGSEEIDIDSVPQLISWSAPFMEIPDNMTVSEAIEFHSTFRNSWEDSDFEELAKESGLGGHLDAQISTLSSGLKQRLRLTLAMGTQSGLVVLDEPCSNLDESGIVWYNNTLQKLVKKTTVVVCSNEREFEFLPTATIISLA